MDNSVIVSLRDIVVEFDGQRILDGGYRQREPVLRALR